MDSKTRFLRGLIEVRKSLPVGETTAVELTAGAGFASGHIDEKITFGGLGAPPMGEFSRSWSGFSWEISPRLVIQGRDVDWWLGLTYAAFPKMGENQDFNAFTWEGVGFSIGAGFR